MARPVDTEKKTALRNAAADYLLEHGFEEFSLRPLAAALGTSARMLIHHFGTREELLREALGEIRAREQALFEAWSSRQRARRSAHATWNWYFRRMTSSRMLPRLVRLFELYVAALKDPRQIAWVFESPLAYWLGVLDGNGMTPAQRRTRATLILATLRGLLLDLAATRDVARIGAAAKAFAMVLRD